MPIAIALITFVMMVWLAPLLVGSGKELSAWAWLPIGLVAAMTMGAISGVYLTAFSPGNDHDPALDEPAPDDVTPPQN